MAGESNFKCSRCNRVYPGKDKAATMFSGDVCSDCFNRMFHCALCHIWRPIKEKGATIGVGEICSECSATLPRKAWDLVPIIVSAADVLPGKHHSFSGKLRSQAEELGRAKSNITVREVITRLLREIKKFLSQQVAVYIKEALEKLQKILRDFGKNFIPEISLIREFQV